MIEALGFAGAPGHAGRDWPAALGPVQEDSVGLAPDYALGWAGTRAFARADTGRLRVRSRVLPQRLWPHWRRGPR